MLLSYGKYLATNNSRRYAGFKTHRKRNKDKRWKTRNKAWETLSALLDYYNADYVDTDGYIVRRSHDQEIIQRL